MRSMSGFLEAADAAFLGVVVAAARLGLAAFTDLDVEAGIELEGGSLLVDATGACDASSMSPSASSKLCDSCTVLNGDLALAAAPPLGDELLPPLLFTLAERVGDSGLTPYDDGDCAPFIMALLLLSPLKVGRTGELEAGILIASTETWARDIHRPLPTVTTIA